MSQLPAEDAYVLNISVNNRFIPLEWVATGSVDGLFGLDINVSKTGTEISLPGAAAWESITCDFIAGDARGMQWPNIHSTWCCPFGADSPIDNDVEQADLFDAGRSTIDFDLLAVYGDSFDVSLQRRATTRGLLNEIDCSPTKAQTDLQSFSQKTDGRNLDCEQEHCDRSLKTVFTRNHNRIAAELAQDQPTWSDERLYQEACALNLAEYRSMVCDGWVISVLASKALPPCAGYNFRDMRSARPLRSSDTLDDARVELRSGDRFNYLEDVTEIASFQTRAKFMAAQAVVDELCFKGWCRLMLRRPAAAIRGLAVMCQFSAVPGFIAGNTAELN